ARWTVVHPRGADEGRTSQELRGRRGTGGGSPDRRRHQRGDGAPRGGGRRGHPGGRQRDLRGGRPARRRPAHPGGGARGAGRRDGRPGGGRRPMTADAPVIGVDLGGTRMRAAVVTPSGRILDRVVQPTPRDAPCPEALLALLAEVRTGTGATAAVIGVPGRVDYRAGRMEFAPNLPPTWAPSLA